MPEGNNPHPAPFPLWLPARAILSLAGENATILDPYAGSGTTCVAAKLLGHRYIGIEISQNYIDYARERITNAEGERSKIEKECALHQVSKTFAVRKQNGEYPKTQKQYALIS